MDCALSSVCFNASGVLMSGLAAPARTATPRPTRAISVVGPATNLAWAAASLNTSPGTTPSVERAAGGSLLDQLGRGAEVKR